MSEKEDNNIYEYEVASEMEFFESFNVRVQKGKVIWCSDRSHPVGSDWAALSNYFKKHTGEMAYKITPIIDGE
jgi:hypothetical protein